MSLFFHELSHLILSLLVALILWKKLHKHLGVFIASLLGGVFIDLDHLIDYFLAFGIKFNLTYFLKGYQFLKTDKIYVLLHSWELVIFLFLALPAVAILFRQAKEGLFIRILILAFSLSLFLHLIVDVQTNSMKAQSYFLLYRMSNNFELQTMVTTDHYQKHLQLKNQVIF